MTPAKAEAFLNNRKLYKELDAETRADWKQFLKYFPTEHSADFYSFTAKAFAARYNYLICYARGDRQKAWCTYCDKNVVLPKEARHNEECACPVCGHKSVVKHDWRIKGPLENWGFILQYDKADYDKNAIVARGVYARRCIWPDELKTQWYYHTRCYYLFKPGQCEFREHLNYGYNELLQKHKNIYDVTYNFGVDAVTDFNGESLRRAAQGTKWQYVLAAGPQLNVRFSGDYGLRLLAAYDKCPQIEYLLKAGFGELVSRKIFNKATSGIINWRAKNFKNAIKMPLSKADYKFIRAQKPALDYDTFRLFKMLKMDNPNRPLADCKIPKWTDNGWENLDLIEEIYKTTGSIGRIFSYVERQRRACGENDAAAYYYVLRDWQDYLNECRDLELNLKDTAIVTPNDLRRAHANTTAQIKLKADEILNRKIEQGKKLRERFAFTYGGIFCRAAVSTEELIAEGKALTHCVGGYAKQYARGETHIIFIRRESAPEKPFYTMEVNLQNQVVQVRGIKNCGMTDEVNEFVEHFKADVLQKIKGKGRKAA